MEKKILSVIFIILISLSITVFAQFKSDFQLVKIGTIEGVIVPAEYGKKFFWRTGYKTEEYWMPTKENILEAEKKLITYLKEKKPQQSPSLWERLPEYNRQYVGVIIDGNKMIWFNFFHKKGNVIHWKREPVIVMGGGDWYFDILSRNLH